MPYNYDTTVQNKITERDNNKNNKNTQKISKSHEKLLYTMESLYVISFFR